MNYHWKRFWYPRETPITLADGGYLPDPDDEWERQYNPEVIPFDAISEVPCLGLLGEPGIGKSWEFRNLEMRARSAATSSLYIDLRSYGDEERLIKNVFENDTVRTWRIGGQFLLLFLDSLDECLLLMRNASAVLLQQLEEQPRERLKLRVACRAAEWPASFENGLIQLWGTEGFRVHEMAPLRRADVSQAAIAHEIEPSSFLRQLDQRGAVPLAIKPVTLKFLLRLYKNQKELPPKRTDLYLQGCRILCDEANDYRRELARNEYSPDRLLAVAGRIAAVTIFCNRSTVWRGSEAGDILPHDVRISELSGGSEPIDGGQVKVSDAAIEEALKTGLFTLQGQNRIGWAHQTYPEFLAAQYLVNHRTPLPQIRSLIQHPDDSNGKLVPQLHETSAWLASIIPALFQDVLQHDPEVLLRSDVANAADSDRAALVYELLKLYEAGLGPSRWTWDGPLRFDKLDHPSLADQLASFLLDPTKSAQARMAAIDIAEHCRLNSLSSVLVDIATSPTESTQVREDAAHAVYRIADQQSKEKLKPLLISGQDEDPDDELKGCALLALWPGSLTAQELFAALTPPRNPQLIGTYAQFRAQNIVDSVRVKDLDVALVWAARHAVPEESRLSGVVDEVIIKSFRHVRAPRVLELLSQAVLARIRGDHHVVVDSQHRDRFRALLAQDKEGRQALLSKISSASPRLAHLPFTILEEGLVTNDDFYWMMDRLRNATEEERDLWYTLIFRACSISNPDQLNCIYNSAQESAAVAHVFNWLLQPVVLGSPMADRMRENHQQYLRLQQSPTPRLLDPPPRERVVDLLDRCEGGDSNAWVALVGTLTLQPTSTHYRDELEPDIRNLPGWQEADSGTQDRIARAAHEYLVTGDPQTDRWLGTNQIYWTATAGFQALYLLFQIEPDQTMDLPPEVWRKWAAITLTYPNYASLPNVYHQIVQHTYRRAPNEVIRVLEVQIDQATDTMQPRLPMEALHRCWDELLSQFFFRKLSDESINPRALEILLTEALRKRPDQARQIAERLIYRRHEPAIRPRAVVAARELVRKLPDSGWSMLWPVIQEDTEFGRAVIESLASDGIRIGTDVTEDQLADLFMWLAHEYPYDGSGAPALNRPAEWKEYILRVLKGRANRQACEAIQRIMRELPALLWLPRVLHEAQTLARRRSWQPASPRQILALAADPRLRIVNGGAALLDVLQDSLERLQAKLQGETAATNFLWNKLPDGVYRPKEENEFSDFVKLHLDDELRSRGIIINREVQIRRRERTDIHVDAISPAVGDRISVIIEAKGSWHSELLTAMDTQLVSRYLKDNQCPYGLYLVGWFDSDRWDPAHRRIPRMSMKDLQRELDAQAAAFSQQGTLVKAFVIDASLRL